MRGVLWGAMLLAVAAAGTAQDLLEQQRLAEARRHYERGEEQMVQESFEQAAGEFQTAKEMDPNLVMAHYGLGRAFMALKRYPQAVEAFSGCRDTILKQASLDSRAKAEMDRARRDEIEHLEILIDQLRTGKVHGVSSEMSGQQLAAEERLRVLKSADMRGAERGPKVPADVSLALGSAYFRMNKLEEAEREYRNAIQVDGKHGPAHNNLAVILMLTGRFEESEAEIKRAEKAGFKVSPAFKKDLESKRKSQAQAN